jgi:hypothetical protein
VMVDRIPEDLQQHAAIAKTNGHLKTFTAAELMAEELAEVKWVVPGILPEGVTLLAGKPKLGKSWLALGVAIAVATGGVALGIKPVEAGDVLYMALEDNRRRLRKRFGKLLTGDGPERLDIATECPRMDDGGAEKLETWLEEHPDARLVVVDILKKVRPRASANRSVYEADYEALEAMQRLAGEYGVSILVVHHLRKMGAADPLDEVSGSTGLSGGADGVLVLKRDRGRADAYLHVTGREIEDEAELALRWDADLASWTLVGDAEEYRVSQERQDIIRVVDEAGEPMAPKDVAELLDKSPNAVKYLMWRMSKDGQLASVSKGRYALTANPANPLTDEKVSNDGSVSAVSEVSDDSEMHVNERGEVEF